MSDDDQPATRGDFRRFGAELRSEMRGQFKTELKTELKEELGKEWRRELALAGARWEGKLDVWGEEMRATNREFRSQMLQIADRLSDKAPGR